MRASRQVTAALSAPTVTTVLLISNYKLIISLMLSIRPPSTPLSTPGWLQKAFALSGHTPFSPSPACGQAVPTQSDWLRGLPLT